MMFEVIRKKDRNFSYVDGNVNMLPCEVLRNPAFKAWRKSAALTKNVFVTSDYVVSVK